MDASNVTIHIGFPKTGSNALQVNLFDNHPEIINYGKPFLHHAKLGHELTSTINAMPIADFWAGGCARCEYLIEHLFDSPHATYILTEEAFSSGGKSTSGIETANRLKHLFPQAKIMVVLRQQGDLLRSMYVHRLRAATIDPKKTSFVDWITPQLDSTNQRCFMQKIHYTPLLSHYAELFGHNNLSILLFEDLCQGPSQFVRSVATFMELDPDTALQHYAFVRENTRPSQNSLWLFRFVTRHSTLIALSSMVPRRFRNRLKNLINKGPSIRVDCPPELEKRIMDYYREDNRKTSQLFGLDLASHGYAI